MRILINGCNGFIASNLISYLQQYGHKVFGTTHKELNPLIASDVVHFFNTNNVDVVIHTIAKGGRRTCDEEAINCFDTLLMFENMITFSKCKVFINIASGAEFDRRYNICWAKEEDIFTHVPIDAYGLAKNIISRRMSHITSCKTINLRLFSCFGANEDNHRLIKTAILNTLADKPIFVVDRFNDFFYIKDFYQVIQFCLENIDTIPQDINCVYPYKTNILDIANMIQKDDTQIKIVGKQLSYTGDGSRLQGLNLPLIGLEKGIQEMIQELNV